MKSVRPKSKDFGGLRLQVKLLDFLDPFRGSGMDDCFVPEVGLTDGGKARSESQQGLDRHGGVIRCDAMWLPRR